MPELSPVAKLRLALELSDLGVALMRQNLRRRHAAASETEIDARLRAWLLHRPGAADGDAAGVRRPDTAAPK